VLFGLRILGTSSSFKTCKVEQAAANAEQRKENPPPSVLSLADSAAICIRCAGHVLYEYRDAATAVATVLIAIFTYTLYGARLSQSRYAISVESTPISKSALSWFRNALATIFESFLPRHSGATDVLPVAKQLRILPLIM
jgi:hypothetical protein